MPEKSGLDLLREVMVFRPDLPVALISGQATIDSTIEAINMGAYAYLLKPVQAEQIRDVISRGMRKVQENRDRRQMERKIQQLNELEVTLKTIQDQAPRSTNNDGLTALIDGLHHELGNVTMAITLNLSALDESGKLPSQLHENIEDLHASADDLMQLVSRLRNFPVSGGETAEDQIHDLSQLLREAYSLSDHAASKQVDLAFALPAHELLIVCDPESMRRAFRQVIENAVEAVPQGGHIRVSATQLDLQTIQVQISDDGPGFSPDMLERIFEPNTTTKIEDGFVRGLGLGLFITRAIIELHHGTIRASNQPQGGAIVEMTIPAYQYHP
jgi:signal transduction histidine kinase